MQEDLEEDYSLLIYNTINLNQKTTMEIILTGTSQGLGKELFDILKKENIKLTVFSRRFLDEQIEFANNNLKITLNKIDLYDTALLEKLLKKTIFEKKIIFINNAAQITPITSISNLTYTDIHTVTHLNYITPMMFIKHLINKELTIINLATGASKHPIEHWSLYCSTKAGFEMFLKVAYEENQKIKIINYDPGVMDTSMQQSIRNAHFNRVDEFISFKNNNQLKSPYNVANHIFSQYIKDKL